MPLLNRKGISRILAGKCGSCSLPFKAQLATFFIRDFETLGAKLFSLQIISCFIVLWEGAFRVRIVISRACAGK